MIADIINVIVLIDSMRFNRRANGISYRIALLRLLLPAGASHRYGP
jgi:hypothetical protein